ncbi:GntR family transcriptional regulator [Bacillus sp. AGMB 02131]|uniref:GntR family transcriptional regulator n=1 Tax=Peribacillus faecalis TaxID=2772559 RepID=A0A927HBS9_9BACI|nr:GntR family transcriptional regulator [Peribacillus faecalis]
MKTVNRRAIGENVNEYAYRLVKDAIMSLQLHPGQSISEVELAASLQISRTPIRRVMTKLKEENLVEVYPQIGTYVSKINFQLTEEAAFMRYTLEKEILKMSCQSFSQKRLEALVENLAEQEKLIGQNDKVHKFHELDQQFHCLIFEENKMEHVWKSISRLSTHYNRIRVLSEMNHGFEDAIEQHKEIIKLIESKNINQVNQILYQHIIEPKKYWNHFWEDRTTYYNYFEKK